ncbi:MAG: hypothetical protein EPO26_13655 [Chloroflexota bacterium]|nr:MAG: hypothetical protein EPO26_13655 [Chloroflexota bacterium]
MIDDSEFGTTGPLFAAGTLVPAGKYRRIDMPGREVDLSASGHLPASFDGRVAVYARMSVSFALSA